MSMGNKSNNETKNKGMALSDDALENVTGGDYYISDVELRIGKCFGRLNIKFQTQAEAEAFAEEQDYISWVIATDKLGRDGVRWYGTPKRWSPFY